MTPPKKQKIKNPGLANMQMQNAYTIYTVAHSSVFGSVRFFSPKGILNVESGS